jgi:MFS transporter, SHS family, sialic acid transporter
VRATGQGLAFNAGRVLAALGAWQMPALMAFFDKSYPKAGETIVLIYVVGMVLIWLAPETKDQPLPE